MGIRTRVLFCTAPRCKQGRESTFTRSRNIKNVRSRRIVFFFFFFVKCDSCTPSCTSPIAVSLREDASFCRRGGLGEWTAARLPRNPRLACAGGPPRPGHGAAPAAQEDAMRPRCCSPPMQNASQAAHRAEQTCGPLDAEPGGGHTGVGLLQICSGIVRGGVGGRNDLRRCICAQDGRFRRSASGVVVSNWSQRRSAASRPDVSASPTETPCR